MLNSMNRKSIVNFCLRVSSRRPFESCDLPLGLSFCNLTFATWPTQRLQTLRPSCKTYPLMKHMACGLHFLPSRTFQNEKLRRREWPELDRERDRKHPPNWYSL